MSIVTYEDTPIALTTRGPFAFGRGYGGNQYGKSRFGSSVDSAGIYQRKRVGVGSTLPPYKRGNRWGMSRMAHYRPTNPQTVPQQAWRSEFADGMAQYALLTSDEKALLSKEARKTRMLGFNLFMRRWLQSRRT